MSLDKNLKNPPRTMIALYGEREASIVIHRCYEVNPFFGEWVCDKIYRELWELEPLTMLEKSLVTVVSLAVLGKEEQLTIHLKGLLNLGKSLAFIYAITNFLKKEKFISNDEKIATLIRKNFQPSQLTNGQDSLNFFPIELLSYRDTIMISVTAYAAVGDNTNTKTFLKEILSENVLSDKEVSAIFLHIMTYCGCPVTMNACSILNDILTESAIKAPAYL